jgi:hypothetical protein
MTYPVFALGDVLNASDMNAVSMWLVKTQTIGNGVSSVTVTGAFSADYDNYKIQIAGGVGSTNLDLRFNFDGNTSEYYTGAMFHPYNIASGNAGGIGRFNLAYWDFAGGASTNNIFMNIDVTSPFLTKNAGYSSPYSVGNIGGSGLVATGFHNNTSSFTGFRLQTSTGTLTGGTIRVYGYRN